MKMFRPGKFKGNSRLDRIWNWNIYMPNQISYLASQHRQRQLWSVYNFLCLLLLYWIMHAQYFALLNLILKLQFCGEASLEFPFFNFPGCYKQADIYKTKARIVLMQSWRSQASKMDVLRRQWTLGKNGRIGMRNIIFPCLPSHSCTKPWTTVRTVMRLILSEFYWDCVTHKEGWPVPVTTKSEWFKYQGRPDWSGHWY